MIAAAALLAYGVAVALIGRWLDKRAGMLDSSCENGRPSTCLAAWSWAGVPLILVALL